MSANFDGRFFRLEFLRFQPIHQPVIDLVMLDPNNPRSVAYQVDRIETHLAALPKGQTPAGRLRIC